VCGQENKSDGVCRSAVFYLLSAKRAFSSLESVCHRKQGLNGVLLRIPSPTSDRCSVARVVSVATGSTQHEGCTAPMLRGQLRSEWAHLHLYIFNTNSDIRLQSADTGTAVVVNELQTE